MSTNRENLIRKLRTLPPERLTEVEDFIDFLTVRERKEAIDAFLAVADEVAEQGVSALTSQEIENEIKALRNERRRAAGA